MQWTLDELLFLACLQESNKAVFYWLLSRLLSLPMTLHEPVLSLILCLQTNSHKKIFSFALSDHFLFRVSFVRILAPREKE